MISVIMSTYKEKIEYVHLSVQSILNQTYRDLELILVPDDPDNREITEALKVYAQKDSRVKVLNNEKNLGLPGALNKALQAAKGEYIARMDADDISHPDRLEVQMQYMQRHNLDLIGARKRCIDEAGEIIPNSESAYYSPRAVMKRIRLDDCLPHSTWLAKKEVFDRVGGYRDMPRCEDFDFLLRAWSLGIPMGMCDQIVFDHRINEAGISRSGMLEQVLASWYLTDHLSEIDQITPQEIRDHVQLRMTPKKQMRYVKATKYFDQAIMMKRIHPLRCGVLLMKSGFVSSFYRRKLATILKLKIVCRGQ